MLSWAVALLLPKAGVVGVGGSLALVQCRAGDSPACISSGEENGICGRDLD